MESISSDKREVVLDILLQVKEAIENLMKWNQGITDMNDLLLSPNGMQDLAGNCMTIMAIGEGFRKIDKATDGQLLPLRPEIPWHQVFGLRNRIPTQK
ncbi:MAG: antitoxin [Bacteroidaceae bacterium]|nr:antitoxin [Bacteroidaceae bacterium]